jgi:hypothetical protein
MRKGDSLRRWLTACLPDLKTHPDSLQVFFEEGGINARRSATLSFAYSYSLKVLLTDYAGDPDHLIVPVLAWIEKEQPQLLARNDSAPFAFRSELLDSKAYDIELSIDLTEAVLVSLSADGRGWNIVHPPEPDYGHSFDGVTANFRQGFGNVELLLESSDPDAVLTPAIPPNA